MTAHHRRHLVVVALLATLVVATDLGARTFANNDEARFPVLARGLLAGDPWLAPTLNGIAYYNKPPLLAWLIALVSWPLGRVTQFTAVLPSAAAAIATVLLIHAFGREAFGVEGGTRAALVAMTTQGLFLHARLPMPDMLMTAFITASAWMLWRMTRARPGPNAIGFYVCTGLAFWAKGPAGLLPLVVALAWAAVSRAPGRWRRLRLLPGLPLLAMIVGAWWLIRADSDLRAMRAAVASDQLGWYLPGSPSVATVIAPLENVFAILFPWVLLLPFAIAHARRFLRGQGAERDSVSFVAVWTVATIALIACSREQRLRYHLPLVAPAALLIGWWWAGLAVRGRDLRALPWRRYVTVAAAPTALLAIVWAWRGRWARDLAIVMPTSWAELVLVVGALAIIVTALVVGVRGARLPAALRLAWVAAAVLLVVGYHSALARRNRLYDVPGLATSIASVVHAAPATFALDVPELPLSFYVQRPIAPVAAASTLRDLVALYPGAVVVVPVADLDALAAPNAVVVRRSDHVGPRQLAVVRFGDSPRAP